MRMLITALMTFMLLAFGDVANAAQSRYDRALEILNTINDERPARSREYQPAKAIMADRLLDRKNRVVGEIRDVILDDNGAIAMLDVEFNRLGIAASRFPVDYDELGIRPVTNGYKMSISDDDIIDRVAEFLAAIEPSSGKLDDTYSLKQTIGRNVYSKEGQKIGRVQDVLFDDKGRRAEYLLVKMQHRALRGHLIAVPFAEPNYAGENIIVSDDFAQAMFDVVAQK